MKTISLQRALKTSLRRYNADSEDGLIETFSAVFHSFGDLHKVAPVTFLARLKRRGVVLAVKPSQGRGGEER